MTHWVGRGPLPGKASEGPAKSAKGGTGLIAPRLP